MSRSGSSRKSFDLEWIERWARCVNDDRILPVIGRFFTSRFVLGVDETEYLIEVRGGKIQRIAEGLTPNDLGYDFGLKAPSSAWMKFSQRIPPPMFNDIWAMAHPLHRQLIIEGNTLPFWQNLRALTRMLSLMRQV
ncbi:MAG TPA: hypothetical protein VHA10_00305 [Hypericibacter adhaerens]|uniref:hypothetical protein n=1 Tax=Hypericibacter adhaerens TaxID=2602016 RepID=UPI001247D76F|nr:hypothetical protein [Hypericibacter adhaerens]HWA41622.1 hypothetical protein [Hypericibacter adhaerens]